MVRPFDWQRYLRRLRRRFTAGCLPALKATRRVGALIALGCAGTLLSNSAKAAPIVVEADFGDFGEGFASAHNLDADTVTVNGSLMPDESKSIDVDYVRFVDLPGGTSFDLAFSFTNVGGPGGFRIRARDENESVIDDALLFAGGEGGEVAGNLSGLIPATNTLVVSLSDSNEGNTHGPYSFTLSASQIPEPGSLALLGAAGLLGAGALRKKKSAAPAAARAAAPATE